jgi:2-haloacid dehalogenase
MLNFSQYEVLTFDCYGTLIDWETGILTALKPILQAHQVDLPDQAILEYYAQFESELEQGDYRKYCHILEAVVEQFGKRFNFTPTTAEKTALPESVQHWPPFSDTVAALKQLQQRYKLVILSNIDDALFAGTAKHLIQFDQVITAEQLQSYKPALRNFQSMIERVGVSPDQILHVAQSLYHDIAPAKSLGLSTVWVNRRHQQDGSGATPLAQSQPDLTVPDLQTLAEATVPIEQA